MFKKIKEGLITSNPVFSLFLGLCSVLAVSNTLDNAIGMSLGVTFVLLLSNIIVSLIKDITPDEIRIPVYIVVIASLTKSVDLLMAAYTPDLHSSLGTFIQLIAANCIILGRAESFASKNSVKDSIIDAISMSIGFMFALVLIALTREILGTGGFALSNPFTGIEIFRIGLGESLADVLSIGLFTSPSGAFITFGIFSALFAYLKDDKRKKKGVKQ
ncbi:MAG TPA: electron transport complex subunit RsxE [Erysipelotrichaceae bacterium]|nr:electron transport complex subunit RsxE [Erysipelotrichaceae bacterium]